MNLSDIMTRIKYKLGIMNIAAPVRNLDGMIATIIKDITVPDFSVYEPHKMPLRLDLNDLDKVEDTATYKTYILPDFGAQKLLYVFNIYYDDTTLAGFGHYGSMAPYLKTTAVNQLLVSNAAASLYSTMLPKLTFEYIHPKRVRIFNQYSESKLTFELGFEHDKSLASIPESCRTSFMELALLDVKENLYPIFRPYTNLNTVYGTVDLKIDSWENAESERKDLLNRWDDTYHLDLQGIYYG